jgi:urease subunit alpha
VSPQPEYYRPMFGAFGRSLTKSSVIFVSQAGLQKSQMLGVMEGNGDTLRFNS